MEWCNLEQLKDQLIAQGAQRLGQGRHRETFLRVAKGRMRYVYKFPITTGKFPGLQANEREARMYRERARRPRAKFAACKLLPNGVLLMEYVDSTPFDKHAPENDWTYDWDCQQAGYDRHGTLKLYDYAEG